MLVGGNGGVYVGYDSIRAMIEMGIVYELILSDRRKEYRALIPYGGQVTPNAAESRLNAIELYLAPIESSWATSGLRPDGFRLQ
jgi:hypothetical protein